MMKQPEVIKDLVYEEMLNQEMQENYRKYLQATEELKEAKAREKLALIRAKEEKKAAITNLKNNGVSLSQIASAYNLTEDEIKEIIANTK